MADLQPVRPPRSSLGGHGAVVGSVVVIAVLLAAVKPWGGTGGAPAATLFPTESSAAAAPSGVVPSGQARLATPAGFDLRYRPDLFGPEPPARWGLWPAGYLTTFGFALPVPPEKGPGSRPSGDPVRSPEGSPDGSAKPGPTESATAGPAASTSAGVPAWPARIDIPEGSHLLVLGISTPLGYHVPEIALLRTEADGTLVPIEIELLPSPWPDHFTVIGIRSRSADGSLEVWPGGRYRLDWRTEPGGIRQSIEIQIMPLPEASPAP